MEKIMMTEEEATILVQYCVPFPYRTEVYENMKENGFIIKSAVEEAEEMFDTYYGSYADGQSEESRTMIFRKLIETQHDAIQELKKRLEEVE
jgi:hypothetical protein